MKKIMFLVWFLYAIPLYAVDFTKTTYEEFYRYHQFERSYGKGWLAAAETLSSCEVKIYEKGTLTETSTTMVSDVTVDTDTRCKYKLKAGNAGKTYTIKIKVATTGGQKFEDSLEFSVL